jgi:hypothetical protein
VGEVLEKLPTVRFELKNRKNICPAAAKLQSFRLQRFR